ncbi:ImmA/IrrE family metallo-endopeptidase [Streptomyces sp. NPDC006197]|uniref:ImmA/IrrE family metallo-endopeptidase n=1 Tax=Streptomyces sp. NPDC006197 TaxID=3156685 RepID=UPI0033AB7371
MPGRAVRGVTARRRRARCAALVRGLGLPSPYGIPDVCRRVTERTGRAIHLEAMPFPADGHCGVWVRTSQADYIFYEQRTSPIHQQHIIGHELGHLLCHDEERPREPAASDRTARLLLPEIDPRTITRVRRRTAYTDEEEQEAELIGSLLLQGANHRPLDPVWAPTAETAVLVGRLERTLLPQHLDTPEAAGPA